MSLTVVKGLQSEIFVPITPPSVWTPVTKELKDMSIALATFAETFSKQAEAMGISHEVLHRVVAVASGGMDTLPHNGAVITLLAVTGMTHKESYIDIGMNTVIIPLISCVVIIILGSIGIC